MAGKLGSENSRACWVLNLLGAQRCNSIYYLLAKRLNMMQQKMEAGRRRKELLRQQFVSGNMAQQKHRQEMLQDLQVRAVFADIGEM